MESSIEHSIEPGLLAGALGPSTVSLNTKILLLLLLLLLLQITDLDMRNGHKGGVRVGFIYIKDMYNHDVGKGRAYAYEVYEAKYDETEPEPSLRTV